MVFKILRKPLVRNMKKSTHLGAHKKQKLKKAQVLEERLLDELPSDDAGEENETI